ncbi:serine/threonine phosphatase [Streptococcus pneumoniae]|nr:serine/threonine phosphatase [Streptococcus pneumoniae]
MREWFAHYLEIENQKIHQLGQDEAYRGMGTTLEVLAIIDNQAIYAHIGDSRIGLIRGEEYHQLTSDHSLVNELLKAGQLTPEEAEAHPQKNIITQSIGQKDEIQPDFGTVILESGDYLLLNSDGLTNMISGSEIRDIVTSDISLADKTETLVRFANNAGGLDNITVALVSMNEEDAE